VTRVSVGLPVFNGERYLDEALADLVAQSHADLDVVISDNGSTDRTEEICRSWAERDPRIRYHRQPRNRGAAWNHNEVIRLARGPYFRWYSYDDRLHPECIEECARALDDDDRLVLAWPRTSVIDGAGHHVGDYRTDLRWDSSTPLSRIRSLLEPRDDESLLHMCYPVYGVVRLETLRRTRLLGRNPGADGVLLVELALAGGWTQVPRRLFVNRRHEASSAMDKTPEQIAAWFDPTQDGVFPMPHVRLFAGYLRAAARADLPLATRVAAMGVVAGWAARDDRARIMLGEVRIRARQTRMWNGRGGGAWMRSMS
jgi:glycosyltransferase involved in cell wall biosynthesis